jgi:hypothetical protein
VYPVVAAIDAVDASEDVVLARKTSSTARTHSALLSTEPLRRSRYAGFVSTYSNSVPMYAVSVSTYAASLVAYAVVASMAVVVASIDVVDRGTADASLSTSDDVGPRTPSLPSKYPPDGHKAAVLQLENDRLVPAHGVPAYRTRSEVGRLQSPIPNFVVAR